MPESLCLVHVLNPLWRYPVGRYISLQHKGEEKSYRRKLAEATAGTVSGAVSES